MYTVSEIAKELISNSPFLDSAMSEGLINISALARKIKPDIEKKLERPVNEGSIVMALKRYHPKSTLNFRELEQTISQIGDIVLRSNLVDFTFFNSKETQLKKRKFLNSAEVQGGAFYSWVQGITEATLIINKSYCAEVEEIFGTDQLISRMDNLSSVTVALSKDSLDSLGIYYILLKQLAWKGVSITELISTTNEITFVVKSSEVEKTFSTLNNIEHYWYG